MIDEHNTYQVNHDREFTAEETAWRARFAAPGVFPPTATLDERENYILWTFIQHKRGVWLRRAQVLRPSLSLRARVAVRLAWRALRRVAVGEEE